MINNDLATKTEKTGVLSTVEMLRRIHELQVENAELQRSRAELAETLRIKEALLEQANLLLSESSRPPDGLVAQDPVTGLMRHRAAMKVLSKQLARCKRHGEELLGHKGRQQKDEPIEQQQQLRQRNADKHTQEGKDQKQAHARRHRKDQRAAGDGGHLICQHL